MLAVSNRIVLIFLLLTHFRAIISYPNIISLIKPLETQSLTGSHHCGANFLSSLGTTTLNKPFLSLLFHRLSELEH
jgi:hypothetical protein